MGRKIESEVIAFAGHAFGHVQQFGHVGETMLERAHAHRNAQAQRPALHAEGVLHQGGAQLGGEGFQSGFVAIGVEHHEAAVAEARGRARAGLFADHLADGAQKLFKHGQAQAVAQQVHAFDFQEQDAAGAGFVRSGQGVDDPFAHLARAQPARTLTRGPGWQRALTTGYDSTPSRVKENTRSAASFAAKPRGDIEVGQRVFHDKFGYGEVVGQEGNKLEIEFEVAGRKRVIDSFISPA